MHNHIKKLHARLESNLVTLGVAYKDLGIFEVCKEVSNNSNVASPDRDLLDDRRTFIDNHPSIVFDAGLVLNGA